MINNNENDAFVVNVTENYILCNIKTVRLKY